MNKKIETILNDQVAMEAQSSQNYLAMAVWCELEGFAGASNFFYRHSDEEREHMLKLIKYINEKGGSAQVPAVKKPSYKFKNIKDLFKEAFEGEKEVSNNIHKIVKICLDEGDYTSHHFMQWFVSEQLEEENIYRDILDKIKLIGNADNANYLIDLEAERFNKKIATEDVSA